MSEIFLHIGTHKTGTTAIQNFLSERRADLFQKGILFPVSATISNNHSGGQHDLDFVIRNRKSKIKNPNCWEDLLREIDGNRDKRIVISSEGFSLFDDAQARKTGDLLKGHDVTAIIYLRKPDGYMKSLYGEVLKNSAIKLSYREYILRNSKRLDYSALARRWAEVFGLRNLIVRVYDSVTLNEGILKDFCRLVGYSPSGEYRENDYRKNVSYNEKTVNALRLMHIFGSKVIKDYESEFWPKYRLALLHNSKKYRLLRSICYLMARKSFRTDETGRLLEELINNTDKTFLENYLDLDDLHILYGKPSHLINEFC